MYFYLIGLFILLVIIIVNNHFIENFVSQKKVCFDPCSSRKVMSNEILLMKEYVDSLSLQLDNYRRKMKQYDKTLDKLKRESIVNSEDKSLQIENLKNASNVAKKKMINTFAKDTSQLSGLSQAKTKKIIKDHFSKPITMDSLDKFKNSLPNISKKTLEKKTKLQANLIDNMSGKQKKNAQLNAEKTANNFINSAKARCECPPDKLKKNPKLETNIINGADKYGFRTRWHWKGIFPYYCSSYKSCAKNYAKKYLKKKCISSGCKVVNPDGMYPSNLKILNKKSNKSRPKKYSFPK